MTTVSTPVVDLDLFADPVLAHPYGAYRTIRDAGPAVYLPGHRVWVLSRYREVRDALRRHLVFSAAHPTGLLDVLTAPAHEIGCARVPGGRAGDLTHGPGHDLSAPGPHPGWSLPGIPARPAGAFAGAPCEPPLRGLGSDRFTPWTLAEIESLIVNRAERLVDGLVADGSFDAVTDLARPFPLGTIGDLIGLPVDGRPDLMTCAEAALQANAPLDGHTVHALPGLEHIFAFLAAELAARRADPLAAPAPDPGEASAPDHVVHLLKAFALPCVHTIAAGLTGMLWLLATHPEAWHALRADPSLVAAAVEESLRLETPVQMCSRVTTRDVRIGDVLIREGERVLLLLGAANRDPRNWPDPDLFDVRRNPTDHLGLGHGAQASLAATLARTHLRAVLGALVHRVRHLHLGGSPLRRITTTRTFASLPLYVTPR